jgi:hypothetical protein
MLPIIHNNFYHVAVPQSTWFDHSLKLIDIQVGMPYSLPYDHWPVILGMPPSFLSWLGWTL